MLRDPNVVDQKLAAYGTAIQVPRLGAPAAAMLPHRKVGATTTMGPVWPPKVAIPGPWRASTPLDDATGIASAAFPTQGPGIAIRYAANF